MALSAAMLTASYMPLPSLVDHIKSLGELRVATRTGPLAFYRGPRNQPGRYFGPFPNAGAVRETLQGLQKLFHIRNCRDSFFPNRSRPCLQYPIGRC